MKNQDQVSWHRFALLAAEEGDMEGAFQKMQELAPDDQLGLPAAHLWIAHAVATGSVTPRDSDSEELIEKHLSRVLEHDRHNEVAIRMPAALYMKAGQAEKAVETLKRLTASDRQQQWANHVDLAYAQFRAGKTREAANMLTVPRPGQKPFTRLLSLRSVKVMSNAL